MALELDGVVNNAAVVILQRPTYMYVLLTYVEYAVGKDRLVFEVLPADDSTDIQSHRA